MRTVLIVKMGETYPSLARRRGDFDDWITARLGIASDSIRIVKPYTGETLPGLLQPAGVVVTGSHAMVTDQEDWSEDTAVWLSRIVDAQIPLLGICYGHQLLAHAMGGIVGNNPLGSEFGTVDVRLTEHAARDRLFADLPPVVRVQACHTQSVLALPPEAKLLAYNDRDPHHAFSVGASAWGVQFHPEFDADIMDFYLKACDDSLLAEGFAPERLVEAAENTQYGTELLGRFGKIINESG
ncbi:glutamine amidotransferase [Thermodesulfobacteriota bacterium]